MKTFIKTLNGIKALNCALIVVSLCGAAAAQSVGPPADGSTPRVAPQGAPRAPTVQEWQGRLMAELQRRKRYPDALVLAAQKAEEATPSGTATLAFALDRTGKVVESSISVSSGRPEFDAAALAMAPLGVVLAPPPPDVGEERISLSVPVRFFGSRPKPAPSAPRSP